MFNTTIWEVTYWHGPAQSDTMYGKEYYKSLEEARDAVSIMKGDAFEPDGNLHFITRQFDLTATIKEESI